MEPVQQISTQVPLPQPSQPAPAKDDGPVPMSFPAFLRNPGLFDRFAHLRVPTEKAAPSLSARRSKRDEKEGKRWVRRKENARFVGNAHIVAPSRKDYAVPVPNGRTTFPQPLPSYLSRNNPIPAANPSTTEPSSANAGRFSLSLKGMRRELRKSGPRTELLVREVEDEIVSWLADGGVILSPDDDAAVSLPGISIGTSEAIWEVSRTPLQLVWSIADDAFTRYVVHCCARYHDVVSFSKDAQGARLTYLLRPNVTRPSRHAAPALDTPPVTDLSELSELSAFESESDLLSDRDLSDAEGPHAAPPLRTIAERASASPSPAPSSGAVYAGGSAPLMVAALALDDGWSVVSGSDIEGDLSAPEGEGEGEDAEGSVERAVAALSLSDADADVDMDADRTLLADVRRRQGPEALRSRLLDRQRRSASSPSRSPARRTPRRGRQRAEAVRAEQLGRKSFYDYLFA